MSLLLPFLNESVKGVACAFYFFAAASITASFGPQFQEIVKSKNTSSISLKVFLLHFMIGFFFFIGTILFWCNTSNTSGHVTNSIFIYINSFVLYACGKIVWLKYQNSKKAKELGISELEYCTNYLNMNPSTDLESL
ncbi:PQ-loop domain-containing transporter [Mycoplasma suis]|uniref:Uncharacterized protein n=1 Tax=Mycoplasma suis (strain Illinois) TaxID=768700 RepID=F0QSA5_MYCSL|nr:PQ-loop domain-containing transporter [Mycoplasma suis]ADX98375.1 Conserved hypothetical protein [Mycoplasma suis str. Illinois]